mgnify:CR=1 FL=1
MADEKPRRKINYGNVREETRRLMWGHRKSLAIGLGLMIVTRAPRDSSHAAATSCPPRISTVPDERSSSAAPSIVAASTPRRLAASPAGCGPESSRSSSRVAGDPAQAADPEPPRRHGDPVGRPRPPAARQPRRGGRAERDGTADRPALEERQDAGPVQRAVFRRVDPRQLAERGEDVHPADRLIAATALVHGFPLCTSDAILSRVRELQVVW